MFNEREALRLRLEQLNNAEIQIIRELQSERKDIYSRLRELDRQKVSSSHHKKTLLELVDETVNLLKKIDRVVDERINSSRCLTKKIKKQVILVIVRKMERLAT
ncbi:hypothetical protein P4U66_07775 [Bacillus licheniformis]|nr:hypothetical protein [Bacillus licheniformis]